MLLSLQGLAIVSSEDMMSVVALVKEYSLNAKVITKVNKLRDYRRTAATGSKVANLANVKE